MNLASVSSPRRHGERGLMLLEMLVYIAVFAVILTLAWTSFARVFTVTTGFRRAGDRVAALTRGGERWREDMRRAVVLETNGTSSLRLKLTGGEMVYAIEEGRLIRTDPTTGQKDVLAEGLAGAEFIREPAEGIAAWRLQARIQSRQKQERVLADFRFFAVEKEASR